jgi:hypothetical protein
MWRHPTLLDNSIQQHAHHVLQQLRKQQRMLG